MNEEDKLFLSLETNCAVIQLPNRSLPSICLQGDTLITLAGAAYRNAQIWMKNEGKIDFPDDMFDSVVYLSNKLVGLAMAYNDAIEKSDHPQAKPLLLDHMHLIDL
jgi:hypothetical protein